MRHNLRMVRLGAISSPVCLFVLGTACSVAGAAVLCVNPGGTGGCYSTISAAVAAAAPADVIRVATGTYKEQVTITKTLSLVAADEAARPVIDATGLNNGIFINGMSAAPSYGVSHVMITGFDIHDAKFEGILIANGWDVAIAHNHVHHNNQALDLSSSPVSCPGIPAFETSEASDCGEGVHLMASYKATIAHNDIEDNSGGILVTDETGSSYANLISGNSVHGNPYACGITMASHPPATSVIPSARVSFKVFRNTVSGNDSGFNGLGIPGAGAGVGIFAPGPGSGSYQNVVINNKLHNNGLPGVTIHNHAVVPGIPVPAATLDGTVITGNVITANAADTEDAMTPGPTGINIYSLVPISGMLIAENNFGDEAYDIVWNTPGSRAEAHFNNFSHGSTGVDNRGGTVTATGNWWGCPAGPTGAGCSTAVGTGISTYPWLESAFE